MHWLKPASLTKRRGLGESGGYRGSHALPFLLLAWLPLSHSLAGWLQSAAAHRVLTAHHTGV